MKKVKFIYNPNSGEKRITSYLDSIIELYQKYNYTVVPYRLSKNKSSDMFFDIENGYDHILIAGGDGTINMILNEIKCRNINLPIGILPTGTANDFSKALNISFDIEEAIENIINSYPKKIDIGKINSKYFINVASAGMFTDVSQRINEDFKNSIGKVSYYIKGIEEAMHMRQFNITVKSKEVNYTGDMYLMLIFNGKTAGNLNLAYKSELDDGYLDVIIIKGMPIPRTIPVLINVLKGEHLDHHNGEELLYFKTRNVNIICNDDLITDVDGEKGPDFPLNIQCIEDGIEILGLIK